MAPTYSDRLMPIDTWPSTTRGYRYTGTAGAPVLNIALKFDPTPYEPVPLTARGHLNTVRLGDELPVWQRNAAADLAKFQRVSFQLNQNYDGLGVPGLAGPAVSMSLVNSLLATPEQPLSMAARNVILDYVNRAIVYLAARAEDAAAPSPPEALISIPVDIAALATSSDIIQLAVSLRFTRQADLVSPTVRALRDGVAVATSIPVDASLPVVPAANQEAGDDTSSYVVALTQFARDFESAFVTADWRMRIGTSSADPSAPSNTRTPTVIAVRMAMPGSASPKGIGFQIGNTPCYFAPRPIASSLQTLQVDVNQYQTGSPYPASAPVPTSFTSVDPNVWLAECLTAVDDILTATCSTPMFLLDRLLELNENPTDPTDPKSGYLHKMLGYKRTLAAAIASTATPVLDQSPGNLKAAAVDKLEQALLRRLSHANALTCVAVFPVTKAHYTPALAPGVIAPRLFGQPVGDLGSAGTNDNDKFALSTAKIPLMSEAGVDASALAFLVTSRAVDSEAYVELKLAYALTHIEHNIHGVPGLKHCEQSRWVTFLTGPYDIPIQPPVGERFAIPVALHALPVPATVVAQTCLPSYPDAAQATPGELKSWDYAFSYLLRQAAQDSVIADVVFNQDACSQPAMRGPSDGGALFAALAQFVSIYPAVALDLETYLRPIDGKTRTDNPDVAIAAGAVAALDSVISGVASAHQAWTDAQTLAAIPVGASPKVEYVFEIRLVPDGDPQIAQIQILPQSFSRNGVHVDNFLPIASVLIDPENYAPDLLSSNPDTGAAVWRYLLREDAKDPSLPPVLPHEVARLDASRTVTFAGLDLFALQNGWASVQVNRNRHLAPDPAVKTTPAFEFTTAPAGFADAIVPLINIGIYSLDDKATTSAPIPDWLNAFFTGLLTPSPGIDFTEPVLLSIETRYACNLVTVGGTSEVLRTVLPINLLAPASTEGAPDPAFISAVGDFAQRWFDGKDPVQDASACFEFGLTVFSSMGANHLPLMKIASLTLAAGNIKANR